MKLHELNSPAGGDPSRIRTCNPRSRNPLLYPVELWDRCRLHSIASMKNPLCRQARSEPFSVTERQSQAVDRSVPSTQCCAAVDFWHGKDRLRQMLHATFSLLCSPAMSPSPFSALLHITRPRS